MRELEHYSVDGISVHRCDGCGYEGGRVYGLLATGEDVPGPVSVDLCVECLDTRAREVIDYKLDEARRCR